MIRAIARALMWIAWVPLVVAMCGVVLLVAAYFAAHEVMVDFFDWAYDEEQQK